MKGKFPFDNLITCTERTNELRVPKLRHTDAIWNNFFFTYKVWNKIFVIVQQSILNWAVYACSTNEGRKNKFLDQKNIKMRFFLWSLFYSFLFSFLFFSFISLCLGKIFLFLSRAQSFEMHFLLGGTTTTYYMLTWGIILQFSFRARPSRRIHLSFRTFFFL